MRNIAVVECRPHTGGTANCLFCRRVVNLTFPHYTVKWEARNIGFCICPGCKEAACFALITGRWPEVIQRMFAR